MLHEKSKLCLEKASCHSLSIVFFKQTTEGAGTEQIEGAAQMWHD